MKKLINQLSNKVSKKVTFVLGFLYFVLLPEVALATSTNQVQTKLNNGLKAVQTVITGIAVIVGIIAIGKILLKNMPSLDDPAVKNETWKSVGNVGVAVGFVAAAVWIVPWIYKIFS